MAKPNKTKETDASVLEFLNSVPDKKRRDDALKIYHLMNDLVPDQAKMWGTSIVGFGNYHYKYESGREGDFFKVGFSPRKQSLSIYIMPGFEKHETLMENLGKYKTGKSCLYIKKWEDIDVKVLTDLIVESYNYMTSKYG